MSDWERTRWLRMLDDEGAVWSETSSPSEIRTEVEAHPDWPVYRLYRRGEPEELELRPVTREELDGDCAAEDAWYRRAAGGSKP